MVELGDINIENKIEKMQGSPLKVVVNTDGQEGRLSVLSSFTEHQGIQHNQGWVFYGFFCVCRFGGGGGAANVGWAHVYQLHVIACNLDLSRVGSK